VAARSEKEDGLPTLSERERDVLACFAHGRSCTYVGARLGLAATTVQTYRARLLKKLNLTKVTDLIRYAMAHQDDWLLPAPPQPQTRRRVIARAIDYRAHSVEREEWPG
jgi:DNA-binding CsgD family transcriptional regulator